MVLEPMSGIAAGIILVRTVRTTRVRSSSQVGERLNDCYREDTLDLAGQAHLAMRPCEICIVDSAQAMFFAKASEAR